ncbi:MAG: MlaD family protein [Segniliparus sp.]|uniref:MlaD family protein n=1 Tax=Segniliparus sp. TaxID=2804064 RepID=UPI003F357C88
MRKLASLVLADIKRVFRLVRKHRARGVALLAVGATLVAAVAVAGVKLWPGVYGYAKQTWPELLASSRTICADFTDATGLYTGNKVKLLDLEVGTVTAITNMPDSVRVEFTVPHDLDLPSDEGVVTMSDSIVTDRHIELVKPYGDGPKLTGSGCIGLQSTQTPVGLSDSLSSIDKLADTILGRKEGDDAPDGAQAPGAAAINDSIKAMARSLDGMGQPIKQSLENLVAAFGDPYQAEADYRLLLANGTALTSGLVQNWSTVVDILKTAPALTTFLHDAMRPFTKFIEHLVAFLPILVETLERYAPRIYNLADKIVPWISGVISWLTPQILWVINQLPPVMNWLTNSYQPGWGAFDITYDQAQGGMSKPMATALCDALRARDVPGIETTCAPGTPRGDGVGLADLLMGAALR